MSDTQSITTGVVMPFGKHKGMLLTRVPVSYLKWMVNSGAEMSDLARAEIERRGHSMPEVELSGHAIDRASLRVRGIWHETRRDGEGLYSWLCRMTLEAIEKGDRKKNGKIHYAGMKFVVEDGEEFPCLKTIMR